MSDRPAIGRDGFDALWKQVDAEIRKTHNSGTKSELKNNKLRRQGARLAFDLFRREVARRRIS